MHNNKAEKTSDNFYTFMSPVRRNQHLYNSLDASREPRKDLLSHLDKKLQQNTSQASVFTNNIPNHLTTVIKPNKNSSIQGTELRTFEQDSQINEKKRNLDMADIRIDLNKTTSGFQPTTTKQRFIPHSFDTDGNSQISMPKTKHRVVSELGDPKIDAMNITCERHHSELSNKFRQPNPDTRPGSRRRIDDNDAQSSKKAASMHVKKLLANY